MPFPDSLVGRRTVGAAFAVLVVAAVVYALSAVAISIISAAVTVGGITLSDRTGGLLHLLDEWRSATFAVGAACLGIMAGAVLLRTHHQADPGAVDRPARPSSGLLYGAVAGTIAWLVLKIGVDVTGAGGAWITMRDAAGAIAVAAFGVMTAIRLSDWGPRAADERSDK